MVTQNESEAISLMKCEVITLAQYWCVCDTRMWNGLTPNDIQYWVYSDKKMDEIRENDTICVIELSSMEDYEVWLCPKCRRLHVFESGQIGNKKVKYIYQLEEEN